MAGGLIKKENVGALGRYPKDAVRNLFLKVLEGKEAVHVE